MILLLVCVGGGAAAQPLVAVRVEATAKEAEFWVDGVLYTGSAQFNWPQGTRHTLEIRRAEQINEWNNRRLSFAGWKDELNILPQNSLVQQVTADPKLAKITAQFTLQYKVTFLLNNERIPLPDSECNRQPPLPDGTPAPPIRQHEAGYVTSAGCGCMTASTFFWATAGTWVTLNAVAYPGYVFRNWEYPGFAQSGAAARILVDRPAEIKAWFEPARRLTVTSEPVAGLQVLVNRTPSKTRTDKCYQGVQPPYPEPSNPVLPGGAPNAGSAYAMCSQIPLCDGEFDFAPGSEVLLSAPPVQRDAAGRLWVFDRWSTGGGQNSVLRIPEENRAVAVTAHFVRGANVSFVTEPGGLKLRIDGMEQSRQLNFAWGVGTAHEVEAPLEQTDENGRKHRFVGWSNGGEARQEIRVPETAAEEGLWLTARYEMLGRLTVRSEPVPVEVRIGETECRTPCTVHHPAGTEVALSAAEGVEINADTRVRFEGWRGAAGGTPLRYRFSERAEEVWANYAVEHKLALSADPPEAASFDLEPAALPGGWYRKGEEVWVAAAPELGYKFRRWEGDLSGTYEKGRVVMTAPRAAVARMTKTPALRPGAVRNAAAPTPVEAVAPGSIISILGAHLAERFTVGPSNPYAQTIAGITVEVSGRYLPLVFVSPGQINAQLPSDLREGEHVLRVRSPGQEPLEAAFSVRRNAPGLYLLPDAEAPLALAERENGERVTPDKPARPGERLILWATGLGPTKPETLDGFAAPYEPAFAVVDPVEVVVGGEPRPAAFAGAKPGQTGIQAVHFQAPGAPADGGTVEIFVRVNGAESNRVLLPVRP
jgi:uncharacterized protein (TIGR03437 family)